MYDLVLGLGFVHGYLTFLNVVHFIVLRRNLATTLLYAMQQFIILCLLRSTSSFVFPIFPDCSAADCFERRFLNVERDILL